jgi:hypothetical protein
VSSFLGQPNSERLKMLLSRRQTILSFAVVTGLCATGKLAFARSRDPLYGLDTDNDRTIDLQEAKKAASAVFDRLDRDHDGTLDLRELRGRLTARELRAADPDRDNTLTKDEYLALVEKRFNAANLDHDGTVDAKELKKRAGQALLRLLR